MSLLSLFFVLSFFVSCQEEEVPAQTQDKNVLPCLISSDLVLSNHNPDGIDYYVECITEVNAGALRIEPGVEIAFRSGSGLRITNSGSIIAVGLDTLPILMHGIGSAPSWVGLSIESNNANNELAWCSIKHAGQGLQFNTQVAGYLYDAAAAVAVYGKLKMTHCAVSNSGGHGIAFTSESQTSKFSHNAFTNNEGYPVLCYGGVVGGMMLDSCVFTSNKFQQIALFGKSSNAVVEENVNFSANSIPYLSISDLFFTADATFEAGLTLLVGKEMGLGVTDNGQLQILGTTNQHVVIKGENATAGYWKGLLVNSPSDNEFNFLDISDGGNTAYYVAEKTNIAIGSAAPAKLTLNACTSSNYDGSCAVAYSLTDGTFVNNSPAIINICSY